MKELFLFELKLNSSGTRYILRFVRLIQPVLILVSIYSILQASMMLTLMVKGKTEVAEIKIPLRVQMIGYYNVLSVFLNFFAILFYFKFGRAMRRAIELNDEPAFNRSFRFLCVNAVIVLCMVSGNFAMMVWTLFSGYLPDFF